MKPWLLLAVVGSSLLAATGCRSNSAIPILERQLRLQEDEIYRLRRALEESQDCGTTISDRAAGEPRREEPQERASRGRRRAGPNGGTPPAVELPSRPSSEVPDALKTPGDLPPGVPEVPKELQTPAKPMGPPARGEGERSSRRSGSPSDANHVDGPALDGASAGRVGRIALASRSAAEPFSPTGDSRQVASIALNRTLTGGIGTESGPGDQGLLVVVEPRDRAGRTVDAPAEMSVVVIDPAMDGDAARVARWDFTPAEVAAMFRRTGSQRAIHVTTAWPNEPPRHNQLQLFVRYVTVDGRRLQAEQRIDVALPGDKTARSGPDERSARNEPAWQRNEPPVARVPGPAPRMATRTDPLRPSRPVWSPERQ